MKINTDHLNRCIGTLRVALDGLQQCEQGDVLYEIYRAACVKEFELVLEQGGLEAIPIGQIVDLEEALRLSTIPFLVEARDWARLPESFQREIGREYVVLVEERCGPARQAFESGDG